MTHPDILKTEQTGYPFEPETPVLKCDFCEQEIYDGDGYFEVCGENYCVDCMHDTFGRIAETK